MRTPLPAVAAAVLAVVAFGIPVSAQITVAGSPRGAQVERDQFPTLAVQAPDVDALKAEDDERIASGIPAPYRYGVLLETPVAVHQAAQWDITDNGSHYVMRLRLSAPGAYSLGVEFDDFDIPSDGRLYLYDDARNTTFGAFSSRNRHPETGEFVIGPFPGDHVVLEYSEPTNGGRAPRAKMQLRGLIYDYRDVENVILEAEDGEEGGAEGGCTINVNCPVGDPFPLEKRSSVRTFQGGGLCSGVLINNVRNDRTPYIYTAWHCGQSSGITVRFGYQQPLCTGGGAPTNMQMSGAQLLVSHPNADGRLLRMNNNVPDSYDPVYHGWTRSNQSLSFGLSMHHPNGSPKKISIDSNGGGAGSANFAGIGIVRIWDMQFQTGGTDGGSSGGPLYDENSLVRGVLTGGDPNDCFDGLYGRFHTFWNDVDLQPWLDPDNTGGQSAPTLDPFADLLPANLASVFPNNGAEGGFTLVNLTGSGFDGALAVTFDGVAALDYDVVSNALITATTPAGSGTVDVAVTDQFGTTTVNNAYTYTANPVPDVDTVEPAVGDVAGGEVVTISGNSVVGVTSVTFGGVAGTNLQIQDATTLEVTTPPNTSGLKDVVVTGNGSDTLVDAYQYTAAGQFINVGPGVAGTFGATPALSGFGDLVPGGAGFSLNCVSIAPSAIGTWFFSAVEGAVPFKGGVLYTFPILLAVPVQASFFGQVLVEGLTIDITVPGGASLVTQFAFADAQAVQGVSMSNGLKIVVGDG